MARTLDIVGERWTLLILRNLLLDTAKHACQQYEYRIGHAKVLLRIISAATDLSVGGQVYPRKQTSSPLNEWSRFATMRLHFLVVETDNSR